MPLLSSAFPFFTTFSFSASLSSFSCSLLICFPFILAASQFRFRTDFIRAPMIFRASCTHALVAMYFRNLASSVSCLALHSSTCSFKVVGLISCGIGTSSSPRSTSTGGFDARYRAHSSTSSSCSSWTRAASLHACSRLKSTGSPSSSLDSSKRWTILRMLSKSNEVKIIRRSNRLYICTMSWSVALGSASISRRYWYSSRKTLGRCFMWLAHCTICVARRLSWNLRRMYSSSLKSM
mmetsp:Transcript_13273/g.32443  ORF Transcript_13273/g.32443 Transcript_13273/m.32443 type:complete len:237 (+) Transcript_13273:251-961(+)